MSRQCFSSFSSPLVFLCVGNFKSAMKIYIQNTCVTPSDSSTIWAPYRWWCVRKCCLFVGLTFARAKKKQQQNREATSIILIRYGNKLNDEPSYNSREPNIVTEFIWREHCQRWMLVKWAIRNEKKRNWSGFTFCLWMKNFREK